MELIRYLLCRLPLARLRKGTGLVLCTFAIKMSEQFGNERLCFVGEQHTSPTSVIIKDDLLAVPFFDVKRAYPSALNTETASLIIHLGLIRTGYAFVAKSTEVPKTTLPCFAYPLFGRFSSEPWLQGGGIQCYFVLSTNSSQSMHKQTNHLFFMLRSFALTLTRFFSSHNTPFIHSH